LLIHGSVLTATWQELKGERNMSLLELPESIRAILKGIDGFVATEVVRRQERSQHLFEQPTAMYTETGRYSDEILELRRQVRVASAQQGYYQMCVPEALGGGGEGGLTWFAAWEHLFRTLGMRHSVLTHAVVAHWATGPSAILGRATDSIKATVLPELLSGEKTMCFGMSEAEAGTDVWAMGTKARRDGDEWVINGSKQWITNAPYADYCLVFAVTDVAAARARKGGVSAFLVSTRAEGFAVDSVIRLFGHAGGNEGTISLADVRVSQEAMVGPEGEGLAVGLAGLAFGRLYNAAKSVGLARWGLEQAVAHARDRRTFGQPLVKHQAITFMLADATIDVMNAHLLGLHAAQLFDGGEDALVESSMAKLYGTEMGCRVLDRAVQIHGGMGLTNELGLAEAWQELRTVCIADGSAEMLRRLIGGRVAQQMPLL
jgi:acyl-CoA dehydrogenase